jgi:uncharacterized protein YceK
MSLSGCGTIQNFTGADEFTTVEDSQHVWGRIYGGLRLDASWLTEPNELPRELNIMTIPCNLIDFPLSFVADTLTLPITLILELCGKSVHRVPKDKGKP